MVPSSLRSDAPDRCSPVTVLKPLISRLSLIHISTKSVNLIVPFGAGSTTDLAARSLANAAKNAFPKPIVVVNRPGAAGVVAAA